MDRLTFNGLLLAFFVICDVITWSFVSSSNFGVRYTPKGFLFDVGGSSTFPKENEIFLRDIERQVENLSNEKK